MLLTVPPKWLIRVLCSVCTCVICIFVAFGVANFHKRAASAKAIIRVCRTLANVYLVVLEVLVRVGVRVMQHSAIPQILNNQNRVHKDNLTKINCDH